MFRPTRNDENRPGARGPHRILPAVALHPILKLGDARLRIKGEPVERFGRSLHTLLDDMIETMRAAPGVGLAAPQIGLALQACVIEVDSQVHELMNPKIIRTSGDERDLEGCLSLPGYVAQVTRRERVWVVAQNRHGRKVRIAGTGLLARALQHELDHLNGMLYIDRLDSLDELTTTERVREEQAAVDGAAADGAVGPGSESSAAGGQAESEASTREALAPLA